MAHSPLSRAALVAAVLAAGASALPGGAAAQAGPVAGVSVTKCTRGPAPSDRAVEFRGSMRKVAGTRRMWMRFSLEERVGDGGFAAVAAPGLGVWRKSRSKVQRFSYRQGVLGLATGSTYRATVQYRWNGKGGRIVKRARRTSSNCRQPGVLPNLRVTRIGGKSVGRQPRVIRYAIFVVNRGRASAAPTTVSLSVDGAIVDTVPLGALAPGEQSRVFVNGPACTETVEARVDPSDVLREASEADNARSVPCPTP